MLAISYCAGKLWLESELCGPTGRENDVVVASFDSPCQSLD
jgi:hypothetical protein